MYLVSCSQEELASQIRRTVVVLCDIARADVLYPPEIPTSYCRDLLQVKQSASGVRNDNCHHIHARSDALDNGPQMECWQQQHPYEAVESGVQLLERFQMFII